MTLEVRVVTGEECRVETVCFRDSASGHAASLNFEILAKTTHAGSDRAVDELGAVCCFRVVPYGLHETGELHLGPASSVAFERDVELGARARYRVGKRSQRLEGASRAIRHLVRSLPKVCAGIRNCGWCVGKGVTVGVFRYADVEDGPLIGPGAFRREPSVEDEATPLPTCNLERRDGAEGALWSTARAFPTILSDETTEVQSKNEVYLSGGNLGHALTSNGFRLNVPKFMERDFVDDTHCAVGHGKLTRRRRALGQGAFHAMPWSTRSPVSV
jgi:hypothetical protein